MFVQATDENWNTFNITTIFSAADFIKDWSFELSAVYNRDKPLEPHPQLFSKGCFASVNAQIGLNIFHLEEFKFLNMLIIVW